LSQSVDWAERRADERRPGEGRTVRLLINGSPQAFAIHNVSRGGLMVDAPPGLVAARSIEIVSAEGDIVPAAVRWTAGGLTGLQFERPVLIDMSEAG
jgi:hypothetical protein